MSTPLKSSTKWPAMIHLECVGGPVKVPDRRGGAKAHGQMEPEGDAGLASDEGP